MSTRMGAQSKASHLGELAVCSILTTVGAPCRGLPSPLCRVQQGGTLGPSPGRLVVRITLSRDLWTRMRPVGMVLIWLLAPLIFTVGLLKLPFTRMQVERVPFAHEFQSNKVARHIFDPIDVHLVREVLYMNGVKDISVLDLPYQFKSNFSPIIHDLILPSLR